MIIVGKYSFHRKSLHSLGSTPNPYEQAISIIGRTLSSFDEDNLIPCFGFGDGEYLFVTYYSRSVTCFPYVECQLVAFLASTHDQHVFSFYPNDRYCHGFEEVLARYREIIPRLKLSGLFSIIFLILLCWLYMQVCCYRCFY